MTRSAPDPAASSEVPATSLRVAVMGAGAVGCYYGGMLARAGHEVTLIGRAGNVDAIRRDGLRFEARGRVEALAMPASTQPDAVAGAQCVLFCVKSPDTESAAKALQPHLAADAVVLSLQNGVDNAERLGQVLAQEVLATVVYVGAGMGGPGHVQHHGRGELVVDASPAAERLAPAFRAAGIPTELSDNVRGALWAKLIMNCAYNALSALSRRPYGELVRAPGVAEVMSDVVAECRAVAQAEGVRLPDDVDEGVRRIAQTMAAQFSSTAQDLMRGRPTEIDHLNGHVVRRGDALGVPTPANRVLHALVKLVEPAG